MLRRFHRDYEADLQFENYRQAIAGLTSIHREEFLRAIPILLVHYDIRYYFGLV